MWKRAWLFVLMASATAVSGCGYPALQRISSGDDSAGDDAGGGGGIDSSTPVDPTACYGDGTVIGKICFAAAPTNTIIIDDTLTIDTGTSTMCGVPKSGGDGYCVLLAKTITVDSTLRATGPKPLVLVASDSITESTDGLVDVRSHRGAATELGAGHDPATCGSAVDTTPAAAGGGAGGSFIGQGGPGGTGNGGAGGTRGVPGTDPITELRGGCAGQDGAGNPGSGGHGGGAVLFVAGTKIDLQGPVLAGGEGGLGGPKAPNQGGGGGAGTGGMIGFDAPTIIATDAINANGGGGGEGGSDNAAAGAPGNPGDDATADTPAHGGKGGTAAGGDGGDGSAGITKDGVKGINGTGNGGGGGGGGGAGLIKTPATADLGTSVSPLATP